MSDYDMQLLAAATYDTPYPQIPGSENHTGPISTDKATLEALAAGDQDRELLPDADQQPQVNVTPAVNTVQVALPAPFSPEVAVTVTEQLTPPAVATPKAARRKSNPPVVIAPAQNGLKKSKARPERMNNATPPPREPSLDPPRQQTGRAPRQPTASRKRKPKTTMNLRFEDLIQEAEREVLADSAKQEGDIAFRLPHACAGPVNAQPVYQHGAFGPSQSGSPSRMNFCKPHPEYHAVCVTDETDYISDNSTATARPDLSPRSAAGVSQLGQGTMGHQQHRIQNRPVNSGLNWNQGNFGIDGTAFAAATTPNANPSSLGGLAIPNGTGNLANITSRTGLMNQPRFPHQPGHNGPISQVIRAYPMAASSGTLPTHINPQV